jgi:hypothetical protein
LAVGFKTLQLAAKIKNTAPKIQIAYFINPPYLISIILDDKIGKNEPFKKVSMKN